MIHAQYTCNSEVHNLNLNRHGYHNIVHSDNQYNCTDCYCSMENVVSREILELCACIIISSGLLC